MPLRQITKILLVLQMIEHIIDNWTKIVLEETNKIDLHIDAKWPNPVISKNGDGMFLLRVAKRIERKQKFSISQKVKLYFPMKDLARKNFPMSDLMLMGIFLMSLT